MDVQRIDGIKYDLDRLTDDEIVGIRGNLLEQHARLTGEVALLEFKLFQRTQHPLPFKEDYPEGTETWHGELAKPETWAQVPEDMELQGDPIWNEYIRMTRDV